MHNSTGACHVSVCVKISPPELYGAQPAQLHTVVLSTMLHLADCQNSFPTVKSVSCHVPTFAGVQLFSKGEHAFLSCGVEEDFVRKPTFVFPQTTCVKPL